MKTKLLILFVGTFLISCNPVLPPDPPTPETSALLGKWQTENQVETIFIDDSLMYRVLRDQSLEPIHRYEDLGTMLYIERLYLPENYPTRHDSCIYNINADTLFIDNFSMTINAVYPPFYRSITFIRMRE